MPYKIAAASSDGKVINQHFGHADKFLIIEVDNKGDWHFTEERITGEACNAGGHGDLELANCVQALSDCKYVLVSRVGPGAESELNKRGIQAFMIADYIDTAVNKLIKYDAGLAKINI